MFYLIWGHRTIIIKHHILKHHIPELPIICLRAVAPQQDSRLFGPSPWKVLAASNEKDISEQPSPWRKSSKRESSYGDRV